MNKTVKRFFSPAMVIAVIALMAAIAGPAWALSITSSQIRNNTITSADVKNSSLTGGDIKNRSVSGADIKGNVITGSEIKNNAVGGADIADGTLGSADVADNSLGSHDINDLAGYKIWQGSLLGNSFASGTIDGGRLAPSAFGARAVATFFSNCDGFAGRGLSGCGHPSPGVYTVNAISTEVELSRTWPACQIGGDPGAGLKCGALRVGDTNQIQIWVRDGAGAAVDATAANPVLLVLP